MLTSIPTNLRISFNHRVMAADFTGLWSLTKEMNNLVTSLSLRGAVKASYCLSVCTQQTSESCGKGIAQVVSLALIALLGLLEGKLLLLD